jgi:hypothetical protein
MRRRFMFVGCLALAPMLLIGSCKKKAEGPAATASASAAASARAEPAALRARLGGSLVTVGDYVVEVLLHADGLVEASLMDRTGQPLLTTTEASLTVRANTPGGTGTDVKLAWDPPRARFSGHAGGGAKLASGPVKVDLTLQDKMQQGTLAMAPLVTGPRFGGQLLAVGDLGAEVLATANGNLVAHLWDVKLEPVTAGAKVEAVVKMGAGAAETVALHWEEPTARFEGKANLNGATAPIDLELRVDLGGRLNTGGMAGLALAGEAHHGGVVLAVGDFSAEIVAAAGLVQAFVMDGSGRAHASGDLEVALELGGMPKLVLKWDGPSASYQAKLGAGLDLSQRPFKLRIESGGRVNVGAVAKLKAAAMGDLSAKGKVEADTAALAQGKATAGLNIEPPSVKITPPKLNADAKASVGTGSGAQADAKANVKAPSISVTPPSVKAGAAASAKAGTKSGFKLGM